MVSHTSAAFIETIFRFSHVGWCGLVSVASRLNNVNSELLFLGFHLMLIIYPLWVSIRMGSVILLCLVRWRYQTPQLLRWWNSDKIRLKTLRLYEIPIYKICLLDFVTKTPLVSKLFKYSRRFLWFHSFHNKNYEFLHWGTRCGIFDMSTEVKPYNLLYFRCYATDENVVVHCGT